MCGLLTWGWIVLKVGERRFGDNSLFEKTLSRRTKLELRRIMVGKIVILGVFVADTTYRANRAPRIGATILGNSFSLGPGG